MMEGEPATPGIVRVADEETAFVGRRVEAPRRHLKQQQRAQKKRLAVLAASAVTVVAFGTVCAFLTIPSESTGEVKTAVSQAMESDPATANADQVFVPSFAVYDEDGDGKVSLGEYLDRLSVNRDAALEKVQASSLDDSEKARIADLLNDDFDQHLECVVHLAQEHNDDVVMTKENFDQIYKGITVEFCPMDDDRIPDSYQSKEIAAGQEELAPIAADPDTESSDLWDPASSTSTSESYSGSQSSYESESNSRSESYSASGSSAKDESSAVDEKSQSEAEWKPEDPDLPPRPIPTGGTPTENGITGSQPSEDKLWNPSYPTDPPVPTTTDEKPSRWNPDPPYYPPVVSKTSAPSDAVRWNPDKPTNPPRVDSSAAGGEKDDSSPSDSEKRWTPTEPTNPPKPEADELNHENANEPKTGKQWRPDLPTSPPVSSDNDVALPHTVSSDNIGWNSEAAAQKYPTATATAPNGEKATGAYNSYKGAATTGAYNAYRGANTGTYNAYTGANTGAYNSYTGAVTTGSANTGAYNAYTGANTGAYNSYTGAATTGSANTGAYNAYTGANTGAYNAYTAAATTDAYNAYKGADTTTYGTSRPTESFPETKVQGYPAAEKAAEGDQASGAYNAYTGATAGAYNAYTAAANTGAYNAYKAAGDPTLTEPDEAVNEKKAAKRNGTKPSEAPVWLSSEQYTLPAEANRGGVYEQDFMVCIYRVNDF
ncbi:hypothetical protein PRIC2_005092 [Phytophthora ramorum]